MSDNVPLSPGMPEGISHATKRSRSGGSGGSVSVNSPDGSLDSQPGARKQTNVGKTKPTIN